ncbi:hypothetical protein GJAV_G00149290 [Gymnothorax javanicus]|nr:hypothetical protein GJAV_G00149290 [Gymnothorax javanicus]
MSRIWDQFLILYLTVCFATGIKITGLFQEQTSKFASSEVVIPRIVQDRSRRAAKANVNSKEEPIPEILVYSLSIEDKDHFLHLRQNRDFVAKTFVQNSHGAKGTLVTTYPKVPAGCHYHGHVEGHEDSLVALSTCTGLRGVIFIGNQSYGLEPAVHSTTFEHLLIPLRDSQHEQFVCGVTDEMSSSHRHTVEDPTHTISSLFRKKRNLPLTRYIELVLVVDKLRFDFKKGNTTAVREEMVDLANLLDRYYKQLNIHVILVGLEIFEQENPFDVEINSAPTVLRSFVKWRRKSLLPRIRHDVAQLIVGRTSSYSGGVLGMAFVGTVCSAGSSGGISVYGADDLPLISAVVAHELGHNLGMNHDDSDCRCDGRCIMAPAAGKATQFSSCSGDDFERLVFRGGGTCLKNQPSPSDIVTVADCGNGLLEEGEQCDCGKPEECKDVCCDAATCKFTEGSACAQGGCCKDCQIQVAGTECRRSVDTCDLAEYCNGDSAFCPEDYHIMDGIPCANNAAYCYDGRCQTYDFQCQHLFGKSAKKAADVCYTVVNTEGTRFGNCGGQAGKFIRCAIEDALCGKVQCTSVDANFPPKGSTLTVRDIQGSRCVNADFNLGPDVLDPAYVNPGSGCSEGKACLDFKCINASALIQVTNCDAQTKCNGNGVCNDQGNCHCDDGWGPPFCDKGGRGGSIDSGPAQIDHSLRNGLLIFFLLVVPVLILIIVGLLFIFKRDWMKNILRKRDIPGNTATGSGQTGPAPQTQAQNAPSFQTAHAYPETTDHLPSYEDVYRGANGQHEANGSQNPPLMQGPDDAFELKGENASFTDTQSSWKLYRQEVLQCLDAFVRNGDAPEHATWAKRGDWDTWARFSRSVEEQQVLKTSKHSRPQMSHLTSEPLVVLLDDNFYYPSMRYEVYQLARKYSLGFCQLYLQCPLNACLTRNRMRRCPLPDEVIVEMAKRIEPPNPRKNQWEQNSLTLTSTFSYPQQDIELLIQMIGEALEKPLSPIQDNAEQKEADRQCCATSILHQADQACRRLVSQAMKDAKEFKWGEINMKSLAAELKQLKTKFLEDLRKQAIQGYPICPGETVNVDLVFLLSNCWK